MDNKQRNNLMTQLSEQFNLNLNNTSFSSINKNQAVKQKLRKKLLIRRKGRVQNKSKTNTVNKSVEEKSSEDNSGVSLETKNNNERNRKNKLRKKMKRLRRKELKVTRTAV